MNKNIYAGVDIGSGSARLAICEVTNGVAKTKHFELIGHKLGHDNKNDGKFSDITIENTLDIFKKIIKICDEHNVIDIQFSATEAIRAASNSDILLEKAKNNLNIDIKVLNDEEEACYAYIGAKKLFKEASKNILTVDIGRGSTDFALGNLNNENPLNTISCKLGTMVFKNLLDNTDTLEHQFELIVNTIATTLEDVFIKWNVSFEESDQIIGLGMSLFAYGYLNSYVESDMIKAEGLEISLEQLNKYAKEQLINLEQGLCHKANDGVISQGDIPVLGILIGVLRASKTSKVMLGKTNIPQAMAIYAANK